MTNKLKYLTAIITTLFMTSTFSMASDATEESINEESIKVCRHGGLSGINEIYIFVNYSTYTVLDLKEKIQEETRAPLKRLSIFLDDESLDHELLDTFRLNDPSILKNKSVFLVEQKNPLYIY